MSDPDFSKVTFKVNAAGSWATLVHCSTERYDEVKAACAVIAQASGQRVRFKVVDAEGGEIEFYGPQAYGHYGWRESKGGW